MTIVIMVTGTSCFELHWLPTASFVLVHFSSSEAASVEVTFETWQHCLLIHYFSQIKLLLLQMGVINIPKGSGISLSSTRCLLPSLSWNESQLWVKTSSIHTCCLCWLSSIFIAIESLEPPLKMQFHARPVDPWPVFPDELSLPQMFAAAWLVTVHLKWMPPPEFLNNYTKDKFQTTEVFSVTLKSCNFPPEDETELLNSPLQTVVSVHLFQVILCALRGLNHILLQ